ncbi:MAG: hypothetical protein B6U94_03000 [Thermofilum sp. ex4484_79]|nr:MAG: hypothetical protein B6U94_03000 [Thermofilum sp. ex4484_79]
MPVISVRVDEELRRKMKKLGYINWSEFIRRAIREKIEEEERIRKIDRKRLLRAMATTDALRRKVEGWSSVEEIRRWRDTRR